MTRSMDRFTRAALKQPCFYVEDLEEPGLSDVCQWNGRLFRVRTAVVFNDFTTYPASRGRWAWACAAGQVRGGQQALPLSILSKPHHTRIKQLLGAVLLGRGIEESTLVTKAERTYQFNRLLTDEEAAGLPEPPEHVLALLEQQRRREMPLWKPNKPSTVTVSHGTPEDPQTAAIQVDENGAYTLDGEEFMEMPYPGGVMLAPTNPESSSPSFRLEPNGAAEVFPPAGGTIQATWRY